MSNPAAQQEKPVAYDCGSRVHEAEGIEEGSAVEVREKVYVRGEIDKNDLPLAGGIVIWRA
jgi:hypothetical protein